MKSFTENRSARSRSCPIRWNVFCALMLILGAVPSAGQGILPAVSSVSLNPTSVTAGGGSTGTVTLSGPAPAKGASVALAAEHPCCLLVPPSVIVQANQTSAQFTVTTKDIGQSYAGWISASYNGSSRMATLSVQRPSGLPTIASLVLNPTSVNAGQAATATVTLSGTAPTSGASVAVAAEHPCCLLVPPSVLVQPNQTSAQFTVTTKDIGQSYAGWISASYNGSSRMATLSVQLPSGLPSIASLVLNPTSVNAGQASTATLTLSGPAPAGGASVALAVQDPCCLSVPPSVIVQPNQTSAQFTVTTKDIGQSYTGWISGSYNGTSQMATLSVVGVATGLRITGTTMTTTQAIITYTTPDTNPCTIQVSESPSYSPLVHEVNPALFPGASADGGGVTSRTFIVGKRTVSTASNGKKYSRALQAYTNHFVRITCGSVVATSTFQTANIPLGGSYADPPPPDPNNPGSYNYPTIDPDRSQNIIDASTGALIRRVGIVGDANTPNDGSDAGAKDQCSTKTNGNGFYHCVSWSSYGAPSNVYAIHAITGEARYLGYLQADTPTGIKPVLLDNAGWDENDPNVYYWCSYPGATNGCSYVLKGTYTGNDVAAPQNTPASFSWTNLTPDPNNFVTQLQTFDSRYDSIKFSCSMAGIQHQYAQITCWQGQNTNAWVIAFDVSLKKIVAAMPLWLNPASPNCTYHANDYVGHEYTFMITLQVPTSGPAGVCRRADGAGTELAWKFLNDPRGTDTSGANSVLRTAVVGSHTAIRGAYLAMAGYDIVKSPAGSFVTDSLNRGPTNTIEQSPRFAGRQAYRYNNFYQSHPAYNHGQGPSSPEEKQWFTDFAPFMGGSTFGQSAARILGQNNTFQVTIDPNWPLYRKELPTFATCGNKVLRDISGPNSAISDATPYTYCVADKANECTSGSAAGNIYVSCPNRTSLFCDITWSGDSSGDICIGNFSAVGMSVVQYGMEPDNYEGVPVGSRHGIGLSRVLSQGFAKYRTYSLSGPFLNAKPLAGQPSWLLFPAYGMPNGSDLFTVKVPPRPGKDGVIRSDFIPTAIAVTPPSGVTVNNVIIKFGYDQNLYCSSRAEACVKGNQPGNSYGYAGDTVAGMPCSASCTVLVPAISQRVLFYQIQFRNASNTVVATSAIKYLATP